MGWHTRSICSGSSSAMDAVIKALFRKGKVANIALDQVDRRLASKMRHFPHKCIRIAAQHGCREVETQFSIAMGKALQQPGAQKAGTDADQDAPAARIFPQEHHVLQNVFQIFSWQRLHAPSINPEATPGRLTGYS